MPSPETEKPGLTSSSWTRLLREEVGLSPIGPVIGAAVGAGVGVGMVFAIEWVVQTAFIPDEGTRNLLLALVDTPTKVMVGLLGIIAGGVLAYDAELNLEKNLDNRG